MLALTKDSRAVQEQGSCVGGFCVRLIVASRDEHDLRTLTKLPRSEQFNQTTRSLKPLGTSDGKFQHVPFFEVETWWHWRELRAAKQKGCWSLHAHIILAVLFVLGLGEQKSVHVMALPQKGNVPVSVIQEEQHVVVRNMQYAMNMRQNARTVASGALQWFAY